MISFEDIFRTVKKNLGGPAPEPPAEKSAADDDDSVATDLDTILAASDKILAINRGMTEPDDRDSLEFRRVHTPDKLFNERIALDAGRLRRVLMRRVAKGRNLKALTVSHFDPYTEGLIVGHPLSSPIEEVNPMALVEQARRITAMGPGGLPGDESITEDTQNVHPSQFGFISPLEGPESQRAGIDVRIAHGAHYGSDGRLYQKVMDRRAGRLRWVSPSDLVNRTVGLAD